MAADFSALVREVDDWGAPTPVPEWCVRDVVAHLVGWFPAFLAAGTSLRLPSGPAVEDDPAAAWTHQAAAVQALLDGDAEDTILDHPRLPAMPLPSAIDTFYTADVFMHSWDLARASRQEVALDPTFCAELLAGMQAMEGPLRASGQYGPARPVPRDAPVQDRLVAFIGRDPHWRAVEDTP